MTNPELESYEDEGIGANGGGWVIESFRPDKPLPLLHSDPEVREVERNGGNIVEAVGAALRRRTQEDIQRATEA